MKTLSTRKGGFTLIELMIVVAIIGILAAIAIPNFLRFQLRAKSSEGKTNLAAIRTAEEGYFAEFNVYVAAPPVPAVGVPGTQKALWDVPNAACAAGCFDTLGWSPEGEVFFQYEVAGIAANNEFFAGAVADIDGNTTNQAWGYVKPRPGIAATVGVPPITGALCSNLGMYNASTTAQDLLETVGPCDGASGQSEF